MAPHTTSIYCIADFIIAVFDKGCAVSIIKGYRSPIATVHRKGTSVTNLPTLGRLIRVLFHERPPDRKLLPSWSLPKMLEALAKAPFEPLPGGVV